MATTTDDLDLYTDVLDPWGDIVNGIQSYLDVDAQGIEGALGITHSAYEDIREGMGEPSLSQKLTLITMLTDMAYISSEADEVSPNQLHAILKEVLSRRWVSGLNDLAHRLHINTELMAKVWAGDAVLPQYAHRRLMLIYRNVWQSRDEEDVPTHDGVGITSQRTWDRMYAILVAGCEDYDELE